MFNSYVKLPEGKLIFVGPPRRLSCTAPGPKKSSDGPMLLWPFATDHKKGAVEVRATKKDL